LSGKLILVGTPIGNIEDITIRALKCLRSCDAIVAEDTRRTYYLLKHYHISKKLLSYGVHNAERSAWKILNMLKAGANLCLVTDSGMPCISDPGQSLVDACWNNGIEIDVVPGPSALTAAISASGLPSKKVIFLGFLPRGKKLRRVIRTLLKEEALLVFFESAQRILQTLREILSILGERDIFVGREMTKAFQQFFRGKLSEAIEFFSKGSARGEFTVILSLRKGELA